jgi:RNA polymerase sigma factor (sigma-70 family)
MSDITYVPTTPDFNADEAKKLLSPLNYQGEEREKQFELLQRLGHFSPTDDGFFGELADRAAGSFVSSMEGVGATLNELGMGSAMQDYFRGVQNVNQHWNAPEDQSIAGYIGGALGSALGSTAAPLAAGVAGSLINPVAGVTAGIAAGFTQSFGNNIQRNREAGYSEDKAYGMAFLESTIDSVIENAPWGVVGKGTKLAANLGRLQKISSAGKKELLNKVGKYMASQVGEKETKSLLKKWGKEAVLSGLGEGGEEALQYLNTYVNQKIGGDPNAEFSINDFAEAIGQGIIGGFGIGGVMSVPGIAHDAKMRKANAMSNKSMVENTPAVENENQDIQEQPLFDTLITEVGNTLGIKIDFMDNRPDGAELQESKNGFYDPKDKTLFLNRETYSVNPAETLGHELKHYLDDNDSELVRAFDNLIESGKNEAGKQEIAEMMAAFNITEKEGNEEFSSDMFGKLIARPETWQKMATMLDEKTPGMGEKFLQTLRDFYALVKNKLENLVGANPEAEHYLKNVAELQDEAARILAELRRRNGNSNQVENVIGAKGNTSVETVPVSQINVDAQRFQFKSNTNKTSGVDETNKLGGDWDARTAGNLYLWQDKNGKLYVVNGHHRLELAQRKKVENVNAIIDRETDGVTAEQARRNGVLINIRDGQGEVRDYASFVRSENLSEDEAKAQGVTARQKGRSGFLLGKSGDTLYEAYTNEVIPETKAVIIADVAKGNEAIEYAGIKLATDRKLAGEVLRQTLKLAALNSSGTKNNIEQGSLFEMADDSVLQEWEAIGKAAAKHIKEIRTRIEAAKDAIKNPEAAKSLGVKTTKGAEKLLAQAQMELMRWENYATDADLMAELRKEAGIKIESTDLNREVQSNTETVDEGRFDQSSEAPLLSKEEDANDFQLVSQTQDDIKQEEKSSEDAELLEQEKIKANAAESTADLFAVQPEVASAENAQTTNGTDFEDRSKEIGLTFDEFYRDFAKTLDTIFAVARKKLGFNGNEVENDWHSAANEALAKAYRTYNPESGASIKTYASKLVKNAINDVMRERKAKKNELKFSRISLDQVNEKGESLGDAVADEEQEYYSDEFSARDNPQEAVRRIKSLESLTPKEKRILDLLEKSDKSISEIARARGVGLTTEQIHETLASIATKAELDAGVRYSRKRKIIAADNADTFDINNPDTRYSRKKLHQQLNPIVRNGVVRDEYADLLGRDGYTPQKIAEWQDEAMDWIVKQGGIVESAIKMANDTAPTNPAVAEIARRYILNSNVFQDKVEPDTRKRLYKREIDARSAWGREGRAMQLNALNLDDVESVQALLDKLHEDMPSEEVIKLRKQIKEKIGVDIFNLPKNIVDDKPVLDAVLREHLSHKSSFKDKFYEYWINGILSGPGTHAANILGNTANAAYELGVKRLAEAVVNVVSGRKNGASFSEFREMAKAINFKDAAQAAAKAWDLEVLDPDGKFLENNLVAIGGKTGRFIRVPGRALKAADAFAKAIIQPMETAAYAYRMGVADGKSGEELQQFIQKQLTSKDSIAYLWARERARELTFQEDPGHFVKHLMALRESPGVTGTIMRFTLPFIKTPYNILRQGVRKGPLGTLNLINETAQLFSGKRKFDDEYVGHFAEQLLAWGTFMAFYTLSGDDDKLPVITGTSTNYGSAEYGFKANKVPPYSIRLGDTWYSYSRIEPLATGLAAIADGIQALRNLRNGKEATAVMKDVLSGAVKNIGEKSYLDSIGETLKIIEDPERNMMKPATNLFASAVPAFLKQARQAFTEEVGDSKSRELGFDWWREQFFFVTNKAGITTAIPKVDYFGRDVKKDDWSDSMFSDLGRLLPIKRVEADKNMDKVERLIWNYNMRNPNEEYYPGIPRNTFTVNKQKMYLAGQDYHDFAVDAGKLAHKQLNNAVKAGYLNVDKPTEKDIELIKKVFSRARKETRQKYIDKAKKVEK